MSDQSWPSPTPRDEMLARVVVRGQRIRMINRVLIGLAIGGVAAAGVVGLTLGLNGTVSLVGSPASATAGVSAGSLTYFACPNEGALGELSGGDRVYLTGRDDSGEWVQVRSPESSDVRVWVRSEAVDPDEQVDLPLVGCDAAVNEFEVADGTSTTTSTVVEEPVETTEPVGPEDTTTTTQPGTTTTTLPGQTTTTTQPPASTSTTAPATTTTTTAPTTTTTQPAPVIQGASVSPNTMIRRYQPDPGSCAPQGGAETAVLTVSGVTNANAVSYVARVGNQQIGAGSAQSIGQGSWQASVGPFAWTTNNTPDQQVVLTITATGPGGSTNRLTSFTLLNCEVPE